MDGEILTSNLDGQPLAVDPGTHEFTFSTEKGVVAKQTLTLERGQHNIPISAVLHPADKLAEIATTARVMPKTGLSRPPMQATLPEPEAPASARERLGPPTLAYVTAGVGLVGIGTGVLLTIWARNDNSALQESCS